MASREADSVGKELARLNFQPSEAALFGRTLQTYLEEYERDSAQGRRTVAPTRLIDAAITVVRHQRERTAAAEHAATGRVPGHPELF